MERHITPGENVTSSGGLSPPLGFRETVLKDLKRFEPQIRNALDSYVRSGDGHSVWGLLYYLRGSDVTVDNSGYVDIGYRALAAIV